MYLKSIEMYGFKSFAHKIKFEFHNGITGIVGPNGSGKSNVSDAVRWVLGEQSAKQLRGASMQDIIFAGTENRKPLSYAYVALTMDNSDHVLPVDYEEVTIARRVYRSGESEYLLNGAPCRLKDVNELFYDTGVGKEGYSIIGQGQIEKILSGKPEERRELFDEAVGIVKYKKRKAATVKKLENERENLVRINDILNEQERRIGPLERQSETAKKYLSLRDDLKVVDVNSFLLESDKFNLQLAEVNDNMTITAGQMESNQNELNTIVETYNAIETEIKELEELIDTKKQEQSNSLIMKNKLESQILILEEQIKSATISDETKANRIGEILEDKNKKIAEKQEYESQKEELEQALNVARENLAKAEASYKELQDAINNGNETIEKDRTILINLLSERGDIKSKEERLETLLEQTNIKKARLNQRLLERKTKESEFGDLIKKANDEFEQAKKALDEYQSNESEYSKQYVDWRNKRRSANEELSIKKEELTRVNTKLESLKNISERYDGYGNSIRRVMEKKDSNKGILGVVSDLISVDKKYEVAIETALGGNIQNIVTEDEDTAKKMIAYLKENKFGRATFLPITSVNGKGNFKKRELLNEPGVLGLASELVKADSKYDGVVAYLLGRVLVTDHIDSAIKLAKANDYSLHIVTLEGEYLSPGGSMTGGHFKNNSNLLSRNREIEELEKKLEELKGAIKTFNDRIAEIDTAMALLEEDRAENNKLLSEQAIVVNTAKLNLARANEQKDESLKAFDNLVKESEEIDVQINDINADKKEIEFSKNESINREKELNEEIEKMNALVDEKTYMQTTVSRNLSEVQIEEANANSKVEFVLENLNRVLADIAKCDEDIKSIEEDTKASKEEMEQKAKQIEEIKLTIEASENAAKELAATIEESLAKRDELTANNKDFFTKRQEIADQIAALDKEKFRLDNLKEKYDSSLSRLNDYMWEEYELTYHSAEKLKNPEFNDLDELKKRALEIKNSIKAMGNVNVNAIEEYKELFEEYTFKKAQRDDLVEAEATLVQIIDELDEGMTKQFKEGFARIQVEFDKSFKELFGGGKGTLELVEDENILEAGIRIIAQPPGKKLQNMMQLSGGEKSLTAIALLFAIQNMKPSPFCLLDEIEAALDDANVDRFSKYLNKLTKNTQFIIITHRRGTMNAADRLYGITMQEKGVSALVSVNLIDADLDD